MLPFYVGALALGGVLIAVSIFLGGEADKDIDSDADVDVDGDFDADADADLDMEADADADADLDMEADGDAHVGGLDTEGLDKGGLDKSIDSETGAWLPFLSMRFWTFGLASFGLTGLLLKLLTFSDLTSGIVATILGVAIGWATAWAFRKLKHGNVTGDAGLRSLRGSEATVLLPIGPSRRGKVRALVDGQIVDLIAETRDPRVIDRKKKVLVVSMREGVAQVTYLKQLPGPETTDS